MKSQASQRRTIFAGLIICLLVVAVIAVVRPLRNRAGSIYQSAKSKVRSVYHLGRAVLDQDNVNPNPDTVSVLFVHHSTGQALIDEGNVRELIAEAGIDFWDHDYNSIGLRRPDGSMTGYSYNIPGDNTDPDGLARLFSQPVRDWPINALSGVMQHDVIIFKSCFPASDISSETQLDAYKEYYLTIRNTIDMHPDRTFIALSPPPLVPESTTPENAARARTFADWLQSDGFLTGHPNLYVYDFFGALAENDRSSPDYNMLRKAYRPTSEGDSHPNEQANLTVGPVFAQFIIDTVRTRQ